MWISLKKFPSTKIKLSDIFFFILFLFLVLYIISARANTGYRFYIVRSNSMKPNTVAGDVAVITSIVNKEHTIQPGEIIAFWNPSNEKQILIHRVIGVTSNGFVTKGDANENQDAEPVSLDKVIGIYRFRIPLLGFFFEGLKSVIQQLFEERSVGWYIIGGGGLLLIGIQVGNVFLNRKQDKGDHEQE